MRHFTSRSLLAAAIVLVAVPAIGTAQDAETPEERADRRARENPRPTVEGSAAVQIGEREYDLPILCYEQGQPAAGFVTDPGPKDDRFRNLIRLTGLARDGGEYKLVLTDGARWYATTLPSVSATAGVLNLSTTLQLAESDKELGVDFQANCNFRAEKEGS